MATVQPSWANLFRQSLSGGLSFARKNLILKIGNLGLNKDAAGGVLTNGRTSTSTHEQPDGTVVDVLANEIVHTGGLRTDHADGQMYNAGVLGIEYTGGSSIRHEPEGTNHAFSASTPATQVITLTAGDYTVWLDDTDDLGTIALTGGATGTANSTDVNGFQFTSTGAAVTFTHAGSNNIRWQVEGGDYRTSFIDTTTAAVTRASDNLSIPLSVGTNFKQEQGIVVFDWSTGFDSPSARSMGLLALRDTRGGDLLYTQNTTTLVSHDGTGYATKNPTWVVGDRIIVSLVWKAIESLFCINYSIDNGTTWDTWNNRAYDGAFLTDTSINLFLNNVYPNNLNLCNIYGALPGSGTVQEAKDWVEANAGSLS